MFNVRLAGHVWEIAGYLAVAGDVFDGVLFCAVRYFHEIS